MSGYYSLILGVTLSEFCSELDLVSELSVTNFKIYGQLPKESLVLKVTNAFEKLKLGSRSKI